jgi:hypothetical protein
LFIVQDTLTILCNQFPLISTINDSSLQCARLRINQNIPSSKFDLNDPSELILFIIIDQSSSSSSNISPVNIILNFNQSSMSSSSINEIRIALLVIPSSFTLNNQSTTIYSSYDIPIFQWQKSLPDVYELVNSLQLKSEEYETDTSICRWNMDRWNYLFIDNSSTYPPYVYILKTTTTQLTYTLQDTTYQSSPSPYLNILYCIPYVLGTTERVLIICFGILFLLFLAIVGLLHYRKGEDNLHRYFRRQERKASQSRNTSVSSIGQDD